MSSSANLTSFYAVTRSAIDDAPINGHALFLSSFFILYRRQIIQATVQADPIVKMTNIVVNLVTQSAYIAEEVVIYQHIGLAE